MGGRSLPVEDHRDRRRLDHVSRSVDQEPLAVRRDHILLPHSRVAVELGSKERNSWARHELSVQGRMSRRPMSTADQQQCRRARPVSCPAHLPAAARRDLNPATGAGGTAAGKFRNDWPHSIHTRPTCHRGKIGRRVRRKPSARMGEACGRHTSSTYQRSVDGPVARVNRRTLPSGDTSMGKSSSVL